MRFVAPLDDAFASRGHVRILRALDELPEEFSASAREIARRADVAHNRASEILASLTEQGLADVQHVARSDLYHLNREHALYSSVHALFVDERKVHRELERFLSRRLRARIEGIEEAYLFGSVSRKESGIGSDIDLAIVVPRTRMGAAEAALTGLGDEVRKRFGSELSVHISREPLAKRVRASAGRALWQRIQAEGVQLLPAKPSTHA